MSARHLFVILCFLFCSLLAFGADLTITVIDGDLRIPLEGAKIVSWDGKEFQCDARGRVVLEVPGDRTVIIRIGYPGYESSRAALQPGITEYTVALRLGGLMEARELVIEASKPGSSETVSGRSVAISGRELARQAETGFVEDVMRAVKLLPGVGYVGGYMAMPSVRGGEPEDITAVYDGFYVERPFHWGGAFSIFDPKMVESAQLSHGVFSARYGHTISGLLDIHAKNPSTDTAEVNLAVSTSATNLNLSLPLGGSGGLALMGRVTYWDPFIEAAKLFFEEVRYITTAPYIRSTALGLSYNFSTDISLFVNGFFGGDGVAGYFEEYTSTSDFNANFSWDNKIGFLTSTLSYTPRQDLLFKTRLGVGLLQSDVDGVLHSENRAVDPVSVDDRTIFFSDRTTNVQGRFDLDWDWGKGIVFSAGLEERYSRWDRYQHFSRKSTDGPTRPSMRNNVLNQGLSSSLYSILEYKSENRSFGMEAGIRGDHFFLSGEDFVLKGIPVANPRINFDFGVLEDRGLIDALTLTAGTGLFSSVNNDLQNITARDNIDEFAPSQNRSWTNVVGTKIDFTGGYTFTLEGYVKYVFSRAYTKTATDEEETFRWNEYFFDGKAFIWGFDWMLQKFSSRYWDGWISYSFINAKYKDPQSTDRNRNSGGWYYPSFHRFHTLNIIFNYKPVPAVHLTTRFSLASGIPIPKTVSIEPDYGDGEPPPRPPPPPPWKRIQAYDDMSRAGLVIPLDIKLAFFSFNEKGKVQREVYLSLENLLSLLYTPEGRKDFDENTGREMPAYSMASYDLPIPLITFGIKWSF